METPVKVKMQDFFNKYRLRKLHKGELLIFPNGTVPPVTYLINGQVGQYNIADDGAKVMLNIFKPGAFFPMSAAINNKVEEYFFEALTDIEFHQAPAADALAFVKENPDVLLDLTSRLYRGIDGVLGKLSHLMASRAIDRLLFELYIASRRFGVLQADGTYLVKLTENQLSQQSGLTRETISRELQKLKAAGTAWPTKQGIRVALTNVEGALQLR